MYKSFMRVNDYEPLNIAVVLRKLRNVECLFMYVLLLIGLF